MNGLLQRTIRLTLVLSVLASSIATAEDIVATTSEEQFVELIEQLTEGSPVSRQEATAKLIKLGQESIVPLASAAETDDKEVSARCFDVLGRLLASDNVATSEEANDALEDLSESDLDHVSRRAKTVLRLKKVFQQRGAQLNLVAPAVGGIAVKHVSRLTTTEDGKTITLERADDGSFTGTITETVDGKNQETPVNAASEKELEEKFPDAHKAWQKQKAQVKAPLPQGVVPLPAGLGQRVVIGGMAAGAGQTIQVSFANGVRRIQVQTGEEKVEISDSNGKDIQVKHTRPVDGKSKTDEYKAANLEELKTKHPEAAKLYEKHAGNNAGFGVQAIGGGGFGGGIQLQIGGARIGAVPLQPPAPGFQINPVPNSTSGPRTIKSEQEGRTIEVTDEDGKKIRVKVTKLVDGKEVSQEFAADDLKTLQAEHPEAAKMYTQLTGRKAD